MPPRSSWELRSSGSGKIASTQSFRGGTLKSRKFLQARQHKYHTPTFFVCTTHWRLTNNFVRTAWRPFRVQKHFRLQLVPILLLVPKSLLHGIPITATAQNLHHAQYLQPHTDQTIAPPPPKKKNPAHYIIQLFWYHMTNWSWKLTCKHSRRFLKHITTILMPT